MPGVSGVTEPCNLARQQDNLPLALRALVRPSAKIYIQKKRKMTCCEKVYVGKWMQGSQLTQVAYLNTVHRLSGPCKQMFAVLKCKHLLKGHHLGPFKLYICFLSLSMNLNVAVIIQEKR